MKDGDNKVRGSAARWYDAGPLSLVGMVVTGILLVLMLWGQYQQPSTEDDDAAAPAAPAAEERASAPAEPESPPPPADAEPSTAPSDLGGGAPSEPAAAAVEPPVAPPPAPVPVVAKMEPPPAAAPPSAPSAGVGPYELELTATAREVWVFVSADGGPRRERRLEKGQSATYKAERGYVVTVDDAAGVKASLNGQALPAFGSSHAARRNITIPSSGS